MIDVHCHLQFTAFENDYDAVAKRAFAAGVKKIINTGTKIDSSEKAVAFAQQYEDMFAIIGVHPHHADKLTSDWLATLERLGKHPKVLGIGEVGIDYYSYQSNGIVDPKIQRKVFEKQIELAYRLKLPLQIHQRHAGKDVIEILHFHKNSLLSGMFHCFAGTKEVLQGALDLGFFIGFDGNVTYKGMARGETVALSEIAKYTPVERMVVETDAPYLPPVPHRGERNEPIHVLLTAQFLAQIKQVPFDMFVDQTTRNVYTIFTKLPV